MTKKRGFALYESLGSPKHLVAPMVDASELAWRQLSRRYGAHLCYTPMLHSGVFVRDAKYRQEALQTCPEDRPLIVQFCANDPAVFLQAVKYTVEMIDCDGIDLNLGCPQVIAKRGHFGSFLQDEWDLLTRMIGEADNNVDIPITAKVRIFEDVDKTVAYAKMLEAAGAQFLTVHGRTREQKGPLTGLASWPHIAAVRAAVSVPVFANGNIQHLTCVERCIAETGVQGVMSAESQLHNPALFAGLSPLVWDMALEYLSLAEEYPCPLSYVRGHIFKLLHHCLQIRENFDLRQVIAKGQSVAEFRSAAEQLRERYGPYARGEQEWAAPPEVELFKLKFPPWICQPYVRIPPDEYIDKMKKIKEEEAGKRKEEEEAARVVENGDAAAAAGGKREADTENPLGLSKKKLKRLERNPWKKFNQVRENFKMCIVCSNPAGLKCEREMCKKCCRSKCFKENLACEQPGHRVFVRTSGGKTLREENGEVVRDEPVIS